MRIRQAPGKLLAASILKLDNNNTAGIIFLCFVFTDLKKKILNELLRQRISVALAARGT